MRIVDRATFLTLPPGTVYAVGTKWDFGPWCIKGLSLENDWYYFEMDASCTDATDSGLMIDAYEKSLATGSEFKFEPCQNRDGCFDTASVFCIMDNADVQKLLWTLHYLRAL